MSKSKKNTASKDKAIAEVRAQIAERLDDKPTKAKAAKAKPAKAKATADGKTIAERALKLEGAIKKLEQAGTDAAIMERARKLERLPETKPRMSMLDAAAIVLGSSSIALSVRGILEAIAERELWQSPNGKTPQATLHASMSREIKERGTEARFRKAGRGLFCSRKG